MSVLNKMLGVLNRLYISWIWLVLIVGTMGFLCSSIVTLHDSYVAYTAFKKYNELGYEKVDPNGDTWSERQKIANQFSKSSWRDRATTVESKKFISDDEMVQMKMEIEYYRARAVKEIEEAGFDVYRYSTSVSVYISNLWGDSEFSNIEYLLTCLLWIPGSLAVMLMSFLLKKWLTFLFFNNKDD